MRRDQTLKVCANHYSIITRTQELTLVTPDMVLKENIGSDRSWVYTATADVSEGAPTVETLAIRFGNSESNFPCDNSLLTLDANLFKQHFENAQSENNKIFSQSS
jgi:Ran-binding protein 1